MANIKEARLQEVEVDCLDYYDTAEWAMANDYDTVEEAMDAIAKDRMVLMGQVKPVSH